MITKDKKLFALFEKNYWNYYIELEEQFMATKKYVAFDKANFKTYSSEYLKLLEVVCSEIDVAAKEIAHQIDSSIKVDDCNITRWWFTIQDWFREESLEPAKMIDDLELSPWDGYVIIQYKDKKGALRLKNADGSKSPVWWDSYNKVKHTRTLEDPETQEQFFKRANLGNVANAFAALYLLEKRYLMTVGTAEEYNRVETSKLFEKKKPGFFYDEAGDLCQADD